MKNKICFITLGCSKNDIDTEVMISILNKDKYEIVDDYRVANIIVVNTCSFILDAKEESINSILEFANLKNENLKYLVCAGCLAQRYSKELMDEIPELDMILGTGEIEYINEYLDLMLKGKRLIHISNIDAPYVEYSKRVDFKPTQFVKISEGCDNHCTYCIIPKLRGKMRSRRIEDIVDEIRYLVYNGLKEVILIAQNTTDYGKDIYGERSLHKLLYALNGIKELSWIRILYMYSEGFDENLIEALSKCEKVLKYVDMPLQHVEDSVLKKMGRRSTKKEIISLIEKLRKNIPNIIIRTTFIVGFQNETKEDFNNLLKFVEMYKLDRVGVFCYSLEEDTPAYRLGDSVSQEEKEHRKEKIMLAQMKISEDKLKTYIGREFKAIVEGYENGYFIGRTYMDAPGIDGIVYIKSKKGLQIGEFCDIIVSDNSQYDLYAEEIDK